MFGYTMKNPDKSKKRMMISNRNTKINEGGYHG
jgi:hypothetical protein